MVQRIAWPALSASSRRKATIAQALCESRPEVGSSRNKSRRGWGHEDEQDPYYEPSIHTLATSSTAIVVRFLNSTLRVPTTASA